MVLREPRDADVRRGDLEVASDRRAVRREVRVAHQHALRRGRRPRGELRERRATERARAFSFLRDFSPAAFSFRRARPRKKTTNPRARTPGLDRNVPRRVHGVHGEPTHASRRAARAVVSLATRRTIGRGSTERDDASARDAAARAPATATLPLARRSAARYARVVSASVAPAASATASRCSSCALSLGTGAAGSGGTPHRARGRRERGEKRGEVVEARGNTTRTVAPTIGSGRGRGGDAGGDHVGVVVARARSSARRVVSTRRASEAAVRRCVGARDEGRRRGGTRTGGPRGDATPSARARRGGARRRRRRRGRRTPARRPARAKGGA